MSKKILHKPLPGEPWKTTNDSCELDCRLTEEERLAKSDLLAEKSQLKIAKEDAKKASASEYKAQIDIITSEINLLSNQIRHRSEKRMVACEWQFGVPEKHQKTLVRRDTGEIVKIMDCEHWELQGSLFEEEEPAPELEAEEPSAGEYEIDEEDSI